MKRTLTFAAVAALLAAASASAQTPVWARAPLPGQAVVQTPGQAVVQTPGQAVVQTPGQATAARTAVKDALFAAAAADGGLTEVGLSQLGVQKATDPELKKFSEKMIEEHTRMNNELWTLAGQKGIALPRTTGYRSQFCAQSLAGLSGEEFDCCYAKAQLMAHEEAIAAFEAEAKRGMDRDVMALASKTLPHIKEHLKMIKPIAKKYKEKEEKEHASTASTHPARTR
jgi:putative membrane protein